MSDWPEQARAAAIEAVDKRAPSITVQETWQFVTDVLDAAAPILERDIRSRIAESLHRAAAGRREYAASGDGGKEHIAEVNERLLLAARSHESSAKIIKDPRHIMDVTPSWRWTAEEHASLWEGDDG